MKTEVFVLSLLILSTRSFSQNTCDEALAIPAENAIYPITVSLTETVNYQGMLAIQGESEWFVFTAESDINILIETEEYVVANVFMGECENLLRHIGDDVSVRFRASLGSTYYIEVGKSPVGGIWAPDNLNVEFSFSNLPEDVLGCADPMAQNYNSSAYHDGSCIYAENNLLDGPCLVENQGECTSENYCVYIQNPLTNYSESWEFNPEGYLTRVYPDVYYYPSLPAANSFCLPPGCYVFESTYPPALGNANGYVVPYLIHGDGFESISGYVGTTIHFSVGGEHCVGCTDTEACNYQSWADISIENCSYSSVKGSVFYDNNDNGMDDGFYSGETGLSNQTLIVHPIELTIVTDMFGNFTVPDLPEGDYTLQWIGDGNLWAPTLADAVDFSYPGCLETDFGLLPGLLMDDASFVYSSQELNISCEEGFHPYLVVTNTGNTGLHGTITVTMDMSLIAEGFDGVENPTSINPGELIWTIDELSAGIQNNYACFILGPGSDFSGELFEFNYHIQLYNENDELIVDEILITTENVVCSFDPNIKSATPEGYETYNFILSGEELEYTIHFQNTGTAVAYNVNVVDSLDISKLDISTFEVLGGSHAFETSIDEFGRVSFYFHDIFLPDSASNEPMSHGFVSFRIKLFESLEGWDEIRNDASIYFDSNDPIVTDEVLHTIFDCNWLSGLPDYDNACVGEYTTLDLNQNFVESYEWSINGVPVGENAGQIIIDLPEALEYTLGLTISNPLCENISSMPVLVHEYPDSSIVVVNDEMTAGEGLYYQWYQNDTPIDGATEQTFAPDDEMNIFDGGFWCSIVSEFGCTTESEWVFFVGEQIQSQTAIQLFPNPASELTKLQLSEGVWNIDVINQSGEIVMEWKTITREHLMNFNELAAGSYMIVMTNAAGERRTEQLIVSK